MVTKILSHSLSTHSTQQSVEIRGTFVPVVSCCESILPHVLVLHSLPLLTLKDYVFPITTIRTISVTCDVFPVFDFPAVSVQDKCTILLRLICHLAAYSIGFYLVGRQQNCQRFIFWNCYWFTVNRGYRWYIRKRFIRTTPDNFLIIDII